MESITTSRLSVKELPPRMGTVGVDLASGITQRLRRRFPGVAPFHAVQRSGARDWRFWAGVDHESYRSFLLQFIADKRDGELFSNWIKFPGQLHLFKVPRQYQRCARRNFGNARRHFANAAIRSPGSECRERTVHLRRDPCFYNQLVSVAAVTIASVSSTFGNSSHKGWRFSKHHNADDWTAIYRLFRDPTNWSRGRRGGSTGFGRNAGCITSRPIREDYFGRGANNSSFFCRQRRKPGTGPNQGVFGTLGRDTFRGPALTISTWPD